MPLSFYQYSTIVAGSSSTPTLVQSVTTAAQPTGIGGDSGNNWKITLPNPVGSNNCLILQVSYPSANTISSISDNQNGPWSTTPDVTATGSSQISSVFVHPGSASGKLTITFTLNASVQPITFRFMEWTNISTSSPVNGHSTSATQLNSGSGIGSGAFTPGSNNSLILSFYDLDASNASANPTSWSAGSGFSLHDADIAWTTNQGFPKASQYVVQSTATSINPKVTPNGDTTNHYNCVSVSLSGMSAGTAPSNKVRIVKIIQASCNDVSTSTWKLQFPTTGNLRLIATPFAVSTIDWTGITDSESNSWSNQTQASSSCQAFMLQGASANPNLTFTASSSGAPNQGAQFWMYDIANAQTSGQPGAIGSTTQTSSGTTSPSNQPSITPVGIGNLVIAWLNNFAGPVNSCTAPSGAIFDNIGYTVESDAGQMNWGNGWAHLITTSTSAESWSWTIASVQEIGSLAIEIKSQ